MGFGVGGYNICGWQKIPLLTQQIYISDCLYLSTCPGWGVEFSKIGWGPAGSVEGRYSEYTVDDTHLYYFSVQNNRGVTTSLISVARGACDLEVVDLNSN
jgi:hypothetical protein